MPTCHDVSYDAPSLYRAWFDHTLAKWAKAHQEIEPLENNTYLNNKRQLRRVLTELKDTVLGQKHGLQEMLLASDGDDDLLVTLFCQKVSVSTYAQIEDYANRMINDSESNLVIPADAVAIYAETTGTTSKSKRFPIHKQSLAIIQSQMEDQNYVLYHRYPKLFDFESRELFLYCKETMKVAADGKLVGSITMYAYETMHAHQDYLKRLQDTSGTAFSYDCVYPPIWRYVSPPAAYEVLDRGNLEPYYMHALFGLKNGHNVRTIVGIFITNVLVLFDVIQKYWRELVHDIRTAQPDIANSTIWKDIPVDVRNDLIDALQPPNEDLAMTIEMIMGQEVLPNGWGKMLFPGLLITQSASATSLEYHCPKLTAIVGSDVDCLGENYAASEGLLGIQENYTAINRFYHAVRFGYTELLPEDQWFVPNPQCIRLDAAQLGQPYEIVTTNINGLYRYRMGDVIKYVEHGSGCTSRPIFQLCYRRGALLNHFGEKVTEEQLIQSIMEAIAELNAKHNSHSTRSLVDYCATSISPDRTFHHTVFIELTPSPTAEEIQEIDWMAFILTIDRGLCAKNLFYFEFRDQGSLKPLNIHLCQQGAFNLLKRAQMARGSHSEQLKVPRAIPREAQSLIDVMMQHSTPLSSLN